MRAALVSRWSPSRSDPWTTSIDNRPPTSHRPCCTRPRRRLHDPPTTACVPAASRLPRPPVLTIQFVPPVRDVVVRRRRHDVISDADGRIVLSAAARTGSISTSGPKADRLRLHPGRSDRVVGRRPRIPFGRGRHRRPHGPWSASEVRTRVIVSAGCTDPACSAIRFLEQGSIDLRQDTP